MFYIVTGMMIDRGEVTEMTEGEDMTGMVTVMTEEGVTDVIGAMGTEMAMVSGYIVFLLAFFFVSSPEAPELKAHR